MRRLLLRAIVVGGLCLCASVVPRPVAASPARDPQTAKAKELFDRAETEFALGHYAAALTNYEEAFRAKALPELLYDIGQCHRYLGDYAKAQIAYRNYLSRKPDASNRAQVEGLIAEMDAKAKASAGAPPGSSPPAGGAAPAAGPGPGATLALPATGGVAAASPSPAASPAPALAPASASAVTQTPGAPAPVPAPSDPALVQLPGYGAAGYGAAPPGYGAAPPGYAVASAPPAAVQDESVTHKWWFWAGLGGALVAVTLVTLAATSSAGASTPSGSLGTVDLR